MTGSFLLKYRTSFFLYFQTPTKAEWEHVAEGFASRWQFTNCLGAVDGKHVANVCPPNSGSKFFNYKVKARMDSLCVSLAKFFIYDDRNSEAAKSNIKRSEDSRVDRKTEITNIPA